MTIKEISIKGYKSFGNNEQVLNLNTEKAQLILLVGNNGNGKSVSISTEIEVEIPINDFSLDEFKSFLLIMGEEYLYIEYIKEKNPLLYEQYITQQEKTRNLSF
jgi:predicted ATP-binding protein involved in virulence